MAIPMYLDDHMPRELHLLDELVAEACRFLESRGLRLGIEYQPEDAIAVAVELIGAV